MLQSNGFQNIRSQQSNGCQKIRFPFGKIFQMEKIRNWEKEDYNGMKNYKKKNGVYCNKNYCKIFTGVNVYINFPTSILSQSGHNNQFFKNIQLLQDKQY